jgi:hypothetical protein
LEETLLLLMLMMLTLMTRLWAADEAYCLVIMACFDWEAVSFATVPCHHCFQR